MAGATVKMSVDVTQFKQGMQQAQQSAKTVQAQMKANEAQYKATGDKEQYLTEKGKLLKKELEAQKTAAANAQKALEAMRKNGVEETSAEYQKLEQQLAGAQAAMYNTQAAMNALTTSEGQAATGAKSVADNLNSISKTVSLDAVIKGVNSITSALETAAQKAVSVGEAIWNNIMDSAAYADDTATLATRMGLTIKEVQQMQYVANRFEAPVETVAKTWKKVKMNMSSDSEEVQEAFERLGVTTAEYAQGKYGPVLTAMRDYRDVFWETGEAIMRLNDESEQERLAQKLLGRSWDELTTLFTEGREAYEAAMNAAPVNSEKAITNAAELNDRVRELEQSFTVLKTEVIGSIAPALSSAAEVLSDLLDSLTEYLQKPEGQELLNTLGESVSALFTDLSNIDPESVVQNFVTVFGKLKDGFEWVRDNWTLVRDGLLGIVGVWAVGKVTSGALTLTQLFQAAKNLGSGKTPTTGPSTGFGNDTGVENVTNQTVTNATVTNETVTNATLSNVTAAVTSVTTTTENVTTMYVQTLITGSGLPGTGNGGGDTGWPSTVPVAIPPASDIFSGYIPPAAVDGLPAGSGTGIGNPAQKYLASGGGGSDINITGDNPTINTPGVPKDAIRLTPDEYEVSDYDKVGFLGAAAMKIGQAAFGLATMDPTGVTAMIVPWLLDNTAFGQKLQQGGTVLEAAEESAKVVRELPATIAKNYQELVDAQYKAVFGKDTKELGADAKKALTDLWNGVENGVLDPIATKVTDIVNAFNEALTEPKTVTVDVVPRGGGVSSWPYAYGGGMGANYSFGLGDHLLNHWGYANGLFSVPWDGYPAILHKGERVLTARENQQYTYNNYFGNVSLNNGLEIDALTDSIARRNQRQRSGFGAA